MGALQDLMGSFNQWVDNEYQKGMERNKQLTPRSVAGEMIQGALNMIPAGRMRLPNRVPVRISDDVLAGRNNDPVKRFMVEQDGMKGRLSVTPEGVIRGTFLNPELRGQGLGRSMYEAASDYFGDRGLPLKSDIGVSGDAARIYDALSRRGYEVSRNPSAQPTHDGGWVTGTNDSVFIVNPPKDPLSALILMLGKPRQ